MNDYRPKEVQNAAILMVFTGAFHLFLSYPKFQVSVMDQWPDQTTFGIVLVILGLLTFCVSLVVWFQKSWASTIIAVVGIASCVALVIFAAYGMIIIIAPIYWIAIKWVRTSQPTEIPDWLPDWNKD